MTPEQKKRRRYYRKNRERLREYLKHYRAGDSRWWLTAAVEKMNREQAQKTLH